MNNLKVLNEAFKKPLNIKEDKRSKEEDLDKLILESTNKLISIKSKYEETKSNWKALKEDMESFSMYNTINSGEDIREQFQKAIDDLKMEYNDTKSTLDFYKKQKNDLMLEDTSEEDSNNEILDHLKSIIDVSDVYEILEYLFNSLVPRSGPANTVAGEIIRALMAIMNGILRNNLVFYEGEGKDQFGSAYEYLKSKGYDTLEEADGLTGDDYISVIERCIIDAADSFISNPSLLTSKNSEDYIKFSPLEEKVQNIEEELDSFFVELPTFKSSWEPLDLTEDDLKDLQNLILNNPDLGIPLGSNLYKIRFESKNYNKGKDVSNRVIYIYIIKDSLIYLVIAFSKADESNITKRELREIREISKGL